MGAGQEEAVAEDHHEEKQVCCERPGSVTYPCWNRQVWWKREGKDEQHSQARQPTIGLGQVPLSQGGRLW